MILTDIRRAKSSGALPWGGAQADQDALYWEAEDTVLAAQVEVAETLKELRGS